MSIQRAEGFAELGMWQDCWEAINELSGGEKSGREAERLRLRCCGPLQAWDLGAKLAYRLGQRLVEDRRAAAGFWLALGRADFALAHDCISAAVNAWPECREEVIGDPVLRKAIFAICS